jgi:hypothetical protein
MVRNFGFVMLLSLPDHFNHWCHRSMKDCDLLELRAWELSEPRKKKTGFLSEASFRYVLFAFREFTSEVRNDWRSDLRPIVEPVRVVDREVHAAVAHRMTEVVVPVRAVDRVRAGKVHHPGHAG